MRQLATDWLVPMTGRSGGPMGTVTFPLVVFLCVTYISCGDDHTKLSLIERDFFSWRLEDRPEFASSIGNYRNSDRLEQFDFSLMTARVNKARAYLQSLLEVDKTQLSKTDQVDYTILQDMLAQYIQGFQWSQWNYLSPITWLEGYQRDPYFFVESTSFDNRGDFENYVARLYEMPRLFEEYKTFMNEAIRLGRTLHRVAIIRVPTQISHILATPEEDSIYYSPFLEYLDYFNRTISSSDRQDIKRRGKQAVEAVFKAYRDLKDYLENVYLPQTRPLWGVGSLPGGQDYYQACIRWYLSLDMTPGQIHQMGLGEVDRVSRHMREIMEKQGYGGYSVRNYFAELKKKENLFYYNQTEILTEYANIIFKRIDPVLSRLFRDQPGLPIRVESMPSDGSRGQYLSGTADGVRPGIFYANTFRKVPKYTMMSLAMHEANPGHHLQLSYELTAALPDFRKSKEHSEKFRVPFAFPSYTAFVEGWALYAESLGVENNLYEDENELMGYYESEIFRAARMVVDTGLHYFNWTRDKAIGYLINQTSESRDGIELEVDRYITWPGQAVAYKVGELRIKELRKYAETELGKLFDIRDFHMVVLRNGAVPLSVLEAQVVEWVQHQRQHGDEGAADECECTSPDPQQKTRCQRSLTDPKVDGAHNLAIVELSQSLINLAVIHILFIVCWFL